MKWQTFKKEDGFWSAMFLIFLVTLGLMGVGGYVLMKTEGQNIANTIEATKVDYAANGAAYYAIRAVENESLGIGSSMTLSGATVSFDTVHLNDQNLQLLVTASINGISSSITIDLNQFGLGDMALTTTGTIEDVTVRDEDGSVNEDLINANADSLPNMDDSAIIAQATAQGHVYSGNYTPADGFPNGSFYYSAGAPNVTYVDGNLTIESGRNVYGIFFVTGNVTINSNWSNGAGHLEGVIYMPNEDSNLQLSMESMTSVRGSVITGGDVDGTGWFNGVIQYDSEYAESFASYETGGGGVSAIKVTNWTYN